MSATKLPLKTRIIYGIGDFYGGASATIISLLFLFFLTDVVGIRAVYAGLIVSLGRFVDAITDPMMGRISDNTRSKYGRRNPYFLYFAIPVGLTFGMLWIKVDFGSVATIVYYAVAYMLFSLSFTAVMVPYAALAPELTSDYQERTKLISTRMAFSIIGALFAAVVPKTIVDMSQSQSLGYLNMSLIFALVFMLIWFVMFFHMNGKEVYQVGESNDSFLKALLSTIKNKAFVSLIGIYLFAFIVQDIMSANFIYFLTYYLKKPGIYTFVMGGLLITAVISLVGYVKLVKKFGKRNTFMIGASYWMIVLLGLLAFNDQTHTNLIISYAVLLGVGTGVAYAIPWSMLPDVVDLDEIMTGNRREGLYSGVMTFLRKLSSSVAILLISFILEFSGYVESTGSAIVSQPDSAVQAIRLIITVVPVLCLGIALYSALKFPVRKHNYHFISLWLKGEGKKDKVDEYEEAKLAISKMIGRDVE